MDGELVGSSAGGEQPKFLATIATTETATPLPVLVKFTAPEDNAVTRRWGSLLQAEHLALRQGYLSAETEAIIQRLYAFGRLIGNSDMHGGNLSFFHTGHKPLTLAPIYDMLPMAFAPRASGLIPQAWSEWQMTMPVLHA